MLLFKMTFKKSKIALWNHKKKQYDKIAQGCHFQIIVMNGNNSILTRTKRIYIISQNTLPLHWHLYYPV